MERCRDSAWKFPLDGPLVRVVEYAMAAVVEDGLRPDWCMHRPLTANKSSHLSMVFGEQTEVK